MVAIESEPIRPASPASATDGIPASARRRTGSPRQAFAACAIGALILAMFSSRDLPSWAERLGNGPLAEMVREAASAWDERVAFFGLTLPHETLRRVAQWLIGCQWP